jgi:hypothetical protein
LACSGRRPAAAISFRAIAIVGEGWPWVPSLLFLAVSVTAPCPCSGKKVDRVIGRVRARV